jgi:hypothetical protein
MAINETQFDIWGSASPPKQYNIQFLPSWQLNITQDLIIDTNPQFYLDIYNNYTVLANTQRFLFVLDWTNSPRETELYYYYQGANLWNYTYLGDINTTNAYQIIVYMNNTVILNVYRNSTGTAILGATYNTESTSAMFSAHHYMCWKFEAGSFTSGSVYLVGSGIYTNYDIPTLPTTPSLFQVFAGLLTPAMVVCIVGYGFSQLGSRINEGYGFGFFFIGGAIGLVICGASGLIPMWIVSLMFLLGGVGVYFVKIRGGD